MTPTEFLAARLDEDEANPDCDGATEYVSCRDWSERHEREVEAKRAIVAEHRTVVTGQTYWCQTCDAETEGGSGWCPTLRHLAAVYADHPDYREEWRV